MHFKQLVSFKLAAVAVLVAAAIVVNDAHAVPTLTPLASFGNGDGFRDAGENVTGDLPGLTDGSGFYKHLQVGNFERGLAYNPATGNLILVSRTNGDTIRILNGASGADIGNLNFGSGVITGGNIILNMVGVAGDGAIYVSNLQVAADTTAFKIYRWADSQPTTVPTTFFNAPVSGYINNGTQPRLGDSLDVTGSGATTKLVAGVGPNTATGPTGYTIFDSAGVATTVPSFTPTGPTGGDFRLGVTFAATANDVWGKQASQPLEETSYAGSVGTSLASPATLLAGETALDYAVVGGRPILITLDSNFGGGTTTATAAAPFVRVYDVTTPATPTLLVTGTSIPVGTLLSGNGNGTGSIKFGAISGNTATIYAMATNQGIQALTLTLDPPAGVAGDYNGNGVVDAADYVLWRNGGPLQNEVSGITPGAVTPEDYDAWRARFGNTSGSGAGSAVPEPMAALLSSIALFGWSLARHRR